MPQRPRPTPPRPADSIATVDSRSLLAGTSEIRILHAGECYRLRLTRNNRLILQK